MTATSRKIAPRFRCTGCKRETGETETYTKTYDDGQTDEMTDHVHHGTACRVCTPNYSYHTHHNENVPEMRAFCVCPFCEEEIRFERYEAGALHRCEKVRSVPTLVQFTHKREVEPYVYDQIEWGSRWTEQKEFKGAYDTYRRRFEVTGFGWRSSSGAPLVFMRPLGRRKGQHKNPSMSPQRLLSAFERQG